MLNLYQSAPKLMSMDDRRSFLKKTAAAAAAVIGGPALLQSCGNEVKPGDAGETTLLVPKGAGLPITGSFLDEISHDIPHQNWGEKEWDADFAYMKAIGIDTVIDIRCGYRKFLTYPSPYLL